MRALQHWLVAPGIHSKRRTTASGRTIGGDPFTRGALFYMLRNRTYLGMIVHRDKVHAGMHPAIVDADLFEAVQRQLDVNARQRRMRGNQHPPAPLKGRVFDADGRAMSPTFATANRRSATATTPRLLRSWGAGRIATGPSLLPGNALRSAALIMRVLSPSVI